MPDEVVYPKFQSTLLQEERPSSLSLYLSYCLISIHAPTRGATILHRTTAYHFQSTLLQEERQFGEPITSFLPYFNPRSYKRSDSLENQLHRFFLISIHAPTRGATGAGHTIDNMDLNFNPRSYKRSDDLQLCYLFLLLLFQSTLLQEERQGCYSDKCG